MTTDTHNNKRYVITSPHQRLEHITVLPGSGEPAELQQNAALYAYNANVNPMQVLIMPQATNYGVVHRHGRIPDNSNEYVQHGQQQMHALYCVSNGTSYVPNHHNGKVLVAMNTGAPLLSSNGNRLEYVQTFPPRVSVPVPVRSSMHVNMNHVPKTSSAVTNTTAAAPSTIPSMSHPPVPNTSTSFANRSPFNKAVRVARPVKNQIHNGSQSYHSHGDKTEVVTTYPNNGNIGQRTTAEATSINLVKPKRPLSAYNIFFRRERAQILGISLDDNPSDKFISAKKRRHVKIHGKISFSDLGKLIGQRWKNLGPEQKQYYQGLAERAKDEYEERMDEYRRNHLMMKATVIT